MGGLCLIVLILAAFYKTRPELILAKSMVGTHYMDPISLKTKDR